MTEYRPLKVLKKMSSLGGPTFNKKKPLLLELKMKTVGSTVPHISVKTENGKNRNGN